MLAYSVVDETYGLSNGMNGLVYGIGLVAAGVFLTLNYTTWIRGVVTLVGLGLCLTARPRFDMAPPGHHTSSFRDRNPRRCSGCRF